MTIRTRLDDLTTKLWAAVDATLDTTDPDPDPDSIAAMNAAIQASIDGINLRVTGDDDPLDDLNAQIAAIVAVPGPSRTQEQRDMLDLLRIVKALHLTVVGQQRALLDAQRRVKTLQRNLSIAARFAMFLDGGQQRVRQTDIDGDE